MVSLVKKRKNGNVYLYLEHRVRKDGKSKRLFQIYLGPEKKLIQQGKEFNFDININLELSTYDFGLPAALMQIAQRLKLIDIINQVTEKRHQGLSVGQYILIAVLNRCIQPKSKRKIKDWFDSTYLQKLLPANSNYLDANAYYHHFPYLTDKAIETIEIKIIEVLKTEFKVDMSQILFDPTNFSTYINPSSQNNQELPRHGRAKDGKYTLNLVGLSLFCTKKDGIPLMHKVYPGNTHDAKLFKTEFPRFLQTLKDQDVDVNEVILTFDKGTISPELFGVIDGSNIKWVCSVRPSSNKDLQQLVPANFSYVVLPSSKLVGLYETVHKFHGSKRRLIVVYNPNQQQWNARNLRSKLDNRLEELKVFFKERLNVKKWRDKENVIQKVEKTIGKKYLEFFDHTLNGEYGQLKLKIKLDNGKLKKHIATKGKTFFTTNLQSSPADVVWSYRQQFTVERAFSYLKNRNTRGHLKVQPIHHRTDASVQGHIFSCVLGLLLLMLLKRELDTKFEGISIPEMLDLLSEIQVVKVKFRGASKTTHQLVKMSDRASDICEYLKLREIMEK